ncbi:MAG: Rpn family recombination-promoting nuclease/putative transposase [Treponema sp.]|nr:Rpn family recombination-promoting nuclease/putative transposase [Treponema sp.]MCI6892683.1 Rpn family recombination-promoting nuclease/putative transposase [Treponema sp.]MCI7566983.1 Rpn family recombination-promoting nuclease/putative transposase [Treponema sp.]
MSEMMEKNLTPEEKWERATIANNFIFYKVMHNNPEICKELLEILLEMKLDRIEMRQEEEVEIDYGKKGIRMDVYAYGVDKAFNIELQTSDTGELPERARYYQGVLDVDQLNKGVEYSELRTSYVIFICIPDIFKKGLGKYSFENICKENSEVVLNDRAYKYFFIAKNYDKILNEDQKDFLRLVLSNECSSGFSNKISKMVEAAKHNTQWRKQFMEFERQMAYSFREGKAEGLVEGKAEAKEEVVVEMLKKDISPELIAECVKLPLEKVLELQEKSNVNA